MTSIQISPFVCIMQILNFFLIFSFREFNFLEQCLEKKSWKDFNKKTEKNFFLYKNYASPSLIKNQCLRRLHSVIDLINVKT